MDMSQKKPEKGAIERLLERERGPWLRADQIKPGDTVTITDITLDETTFERPYLIVEGTLKDGTQTRVRLSAQNVKRIAETLGTSEAAWIGHRIEAVSIESYPGLAKKRGVPEVKGIIWRGVKTTPAILDEEVKGFLMAHASQIGPDIPGPASNIKPEILMEAKRRGLIDLFEIKGRQMYILTEAGKRLTEA